MQLRPDKEFCQAVLDLQGNPSFQKIIIGMQAYRLECGLKFPRMKGEELIQLQGRAELAMEFITSADPKVAYAELDRLKQAEAVKNMKIPF